MTDGGDSNSRSIYVSMYIGIEIEREDACRCVRLYGSVEIGRTKCERGRIVLRRAVSVKKFVSSCVYHSLHVG